MADQWKKYREQMMGQAGIVVFVFGNKLDSGGKVIPSNGMRQEFEIAVKAGLIPIPIGATGFMAEELWKEVSANLKNYIPSADKEFEADFVLLGDASRPPDELLPIIYRLTEYLQKN